MKVLKTINYYNNINQEMNKDGRLKIMLQNPCSSAFYVQIMEKKSEKVLFSLSSH